MTGVDIPIILLAIVGGAVALGLAIALIVVAVKVTGGLISAAFWLIKHLVVFVFGVLGDLVRLVGALVAALVAIPFATGNVILARWPKAEHWGRALRRECLIAGYSLWSAAVRRPLSLFCLDGVLTGVEERLPQDDGAVPERPRPRDRHERGRDPVHFDGYSIEGTLRPGGSGAKLYIAAPNASKRARLAGRTADKVVIKSFALEEGSSLPQIVRESRALDAARAMGLVLDHGLDHGRFWYAMPYHAGENLNETTRFLHARSGADGLTGEDLREGIGYVRTLVQTLIRYHEGGLWHKDVKPDNIIVHERMAHLVDLGLVTPLRSAMTLTTHGTEYFRDPEMVRQALRGVRVHQVDGAKFDVYGAGAVLYFLLENTFPAHGGLSAFSKRSPESLRWIVRRAMADYHQRYPSARAMGEDLDAVFAAVDPWAVRPVDLPSMRGASDPHGPMGIGAGPVEGLPWQHRPAPPMPPRAAPAYGAGAMAWSPAGRPKLVVTNWWRGAYASPDVAARMGDAVIADRAARTALEVKRPARREPPRLPAMFGVILFLGVITTLVLVSLEQRSAQRSATMELAAIPAVERVVAASSPSSKLTPPIPGARLVVVNDHPTPANPEVQAAVERVLTKYEARGFSVIRDDRDAAARASLALAKAGASERFDGDAVESNTDLEAALAHGGYFGALHVVAEDGQGSPLERLSVRLEGDAASSAAKAAKAAKRSPKSKAVSNGSRVSPPSSPLSPRDWSGGWSKWGFDTSSAVRTRIRLQQPFLRLEIAPHAGNETPTAAIEERSSRLRPAV